MSLNPEGFTELCKSVSDDTARDIIAYRKKIKKPLTARAARAIASELAKVQPHMREQAVDHWLNCGWQGFKAEWFMTSLGRTRGKETDLQRMDREMKEAIYGKEETYATGSGNLFGDFEDVQRLPRIIEH